MSESESCNSCGPKQDPDTAVQDQLIQEALGIIKHKFLVMSASVGYIMKGTSHHGGGRRARDASSCCGASTPCEHPKRCCTK